MRRGVVVVHPPPHPCCRTRRSTGAGTTALQWQRCASASGALVRCRRVGGGGLAVGRGWRRIGQAFVCVLVGATLHAVRNCLRTCFRGFPGGAGNTMDLPHCLFGTVWKTYFGKSLRGPSLVVVSCCILITKHRGGGVSCTTGKLRASKISGHSGPEAHGPSKGLRSHLGSSADSQSTPFGL